MYSVYKCVLYTVEPEGWEGGKNGEGGRGRERERGRGRVCVCVSVCEGESENIILQRS